MEERPLENHRLKVFTQVSKTPNLSFESMLGRETMSDDEEEDSIELDRFAVVKCFRCVGDGAGMKLLVCSVIGCPIAVHEECMPSEPEIDEKGRFYCPHCAHKRALLRMEKLRRKALRAKEVLSMFIMSREVSVPVRNVGEIEGIEMERDERGETENKVMEVEVNEDTEMDEDVRKDDPEQQCVLERSEDNAVDQRDMDSHSVRGNEEQMRQGGVDAVVPDSGDFWGGSPLLRKKRYKKRAHRVQVQRMIPKRIVSSPLKKSSSCQPDAVEEDGEKPSERDTSSSASKCRKVTELDHNEKGDALARSSDVPELNQNEKAATSSGFRRSPELNQNERVTTSYADLNKAPESDHNEKITNNLSSELRDIPDQSQNEKATEISKSRKVPDSNQNGKATSSTEPVKVPESGREEFLLHFGKRKRVNWTADELKMLKEGVQFFSAQVHKNIPWRKILEHGNHVFHKTRIPDNLKDKWKVLCREASDKKQT